MLVVQKTIRRGFDSIFWQRLCQKYKHLSILSINTTTTDFVFDFADVRGDVNDERGLGIGGYEEQFIEQRLQEIAGQELIEIIRNAGISIKVRILVLLSGISKQH